MAEDVFQKLADLQREIEGAQPETAEALEAFRIKYLGSKGLLKEVFRWIKDVPPEKKRDFGKQANALKQAAQAHYEALKSRIEAGRERETGLKGDLSAPGPPIPLGARHPLAIVTNRIIHIFTKLGFAIAEDREIEDDWHNFTAMNTPENHPARDMQDTYYLRDFPEMLLRTHTSSVQARTMTRQKPPIRIIAPGRVYRNETISARAHAQFHQVEGLYVDKNVSFADLKQTLFFFAREMYGEKTRIRLRPSYFPFTEPSAEMDVSCFICDAKGCNICKYTGWVEILGCGMVDPAVLENVGIDPDEYSGFAFGMGIERQAMLLYKINDIRLFFENDARFLKQFTSAF